MSKTSSGERQEGEVLPVDRLSDLPDPVLSHILSFLPTTREVVATSILSKRWENLWTSVHNLNFENKRSYNYSIRKGSKVPKEMQFAQFVYRVLQFNKGSINNMRIYCPSNGVNEYDADEWISTAIDRGVECLDLDLVDFVFRLPSCLFNSKTLVDLTLVHIDICNLNTPSAPFFPSLRKLHFDPKRFYPEFLERVISGCPALEHLIVTIRFSVSCNITSSTVKKLELSSFHCDRFPESKIVLDVPAIEFLKIFGILSELFVEDRLSSLVEVDICYASRDLVNEDLCRDSFERFLQLISSVKVLRLKCWFSKPLTSPMNAQFHNLTELAIMSPFFEWTLVKTLMESSVNLQSITLDQESIYVYHLDEDQRVMWSEPQAVPACLLSSLRKVSIKGFGIENELDKLTYVLENAQVLERMDILCCGREYDYKFQTQVLQKLYTIKGASTCDISFV